ncbi:WXG100 family type VII secretion target [Catenulispora sp. GP43]|uniref:WXG100 family type VII secretion target n=1 Tax=Catenulispora sp. GP43 TaxID=3156263 RepID=UPI003517B44B
MASISITYHDMSDAAGKLTSYQTQIQDTLKQAQSLVQNLVSSGFVTEAASKAFDHAYAEFTQGASKMIEGMEGMSKYLNNAAQTMQQTDEQLAKGIGG